MSTRVAILGANGQVGSHLVREFAARPEFEVVAVCRNTVGLAQFDFSHCKVRLGSASNVGAAADLLGDCDVIINCIWPSGSARAVLSESENIVRALAALEGQRKIILLSSVAVHGTCIDATRTSFERPKPDSPYGHQKLAVEQFALRVFRDRASHLYILRLGHVYGAHQWLSDEILTLLEKGELLLPYGGSRSSNAIHVSQVASALMWLAQSSTHGGIYNLTSNPQRSWRELFDWHARICGLPKAGALDEQRSDALRSRFLRELKRSGLTTSLVLVGHWIRSLPFSALLNSAQIRAFLSPAVSLLPRSPQNRLKATAAVMMVRAQIKTAAVQQTGTPWHCSDAMPGPYIETPLSDADMSRIERELASWYQTKSVMPRFT